MSLGVTLYVLDFVTNVAVSRQGNLCKTSLQHVRHTESSLTEGLSLQQKITSEQ